MDKNKKNQAEEMEQDIPTTGEAGGQKSGDMGDVGAGYKDISDMDMEMEDTEE